MIQALFRKSLFAASFAALVFGSVPGPARAAIETDPVALYATMRKAYDAGAARQWPFADELYYLTTIFDAGRAYSLFRNTDAQYAEIALLAVDVATQLHYNPLTNNDAALWYVREASNWVVAHADAAHVAEAQALLGRVEAGEGAPRTLAQQAEEDALANARAFHRDGDALVQVIIADVRAFNLTKDPAYRSLLLQHAADPALPLLRVPEPESSQMFALSNAAGSDDPSFSEADRANAKTIAYRRSHTPGLEIIGRVRALPHDVKLTRTAPADEYFGHAKISPLGVRNELTRINKYLDVGWGSRMAPDALVVAGSIEDWQHQYPHDATVPQHLLEVYRLLKRVAADSTEPVASRMKNTLLIEYSSSLQARELAAS